MQGQDRVTSLGVTSGFVAGTLVHTDQGLVPIEQLKVGDMVLSKDESNTGEQAYKRVVSTFKSATRQPIMAVPFMSKSLNDISESLEDFAASLTDYNQAEDTRTFDQEKFDVRVKEVIDFFEKKYQTSFEPDDVPSRYYSSYDMHLFCTDNHPFWVEGQGWTTAEKLCANDTLQSYDGDILRVTDEFDAKKYSPLYITSIPGVAAYFLLDGYKEDTVQHKCFVDFRLGRPTFPFPQLTEGNILNVNDQEKYSRWLSVFRRGIHPLEPVYLRLNDPAYPAQISNIDRPLVDFSDCCTCKSTDFNHTLSYGIEANCCDPDDGTPRFEDYVYNIEVEDFHTYYVGYAGVWINHKNDNHTASKNQSTR